MSNMAIAWVRVGDGVRNSLNCPEQFIRTLVERENITTGVASAASTTCPVGANAAIVTAVDAALIVTSGAATPTAAPTLGVDVAIGEKAYFWAQPDVTMIAGIER